MTAIPSEELQEVLIAFRVITDNETSRNNKNNRAKTSELLRPVQLSCLFFVLSPLKDSIISMLQDSPPRNREGFTTFVKLPSKIEPKQLFFNWCTKMFFSFEYGVRV